MAVCDTDLSLRLDGRDSNERRLALLMKHVADLPSIVTCVEVKERIDQCSRNNRRISINETSSEGGISHGKKRFKSGLKHCSMELVSGLFL